MYESSQPTCPEPSEYERSVDANEYGHTLWSGMSGLVYVAVGEGGAFRNGKYDFRKFRQYDFKWPREAAGLVEGALFEAEQHDVYVCPMLRSLDRRFVANKGYGIGGRHVWADVDRTGEQVDELIAPLLKDGSFVVDSGRGRHVYLGLDKEHSPGEIEHLNRALAERLGGDSKWADNTLLRLPGTFNHKPRAEGLASIPVRLVRP